MDLSKSGNLSEHYQRIASTLLEIESKIPFWSFFVSNYSDNIEKNLAFIPNEVLDSYLEDLLDFNVSDHKLFIYRSNYLTPYYLISLFGLLIAIYFGLQLASQGFSFLYACTAVFIIALPSALLWHLSPKIYPNRRLFFAKLIAKELDRRNGNSKNNDKNFKQRLRKLISISNEQLPEMSLEKLH